MFSIERLKSWCSCSRAEIVIYLYHSMWGQEFRITNKAFSNLLKEYLWVLSRIIFYKGRILDIVTHSRKSLYCKCARNTLAAPLWWCRCCGADDANNKTHTPFVVQAVLSLLLGLQVKGQILFQYWARVLDFIHFTLAGYSHHSHTSSITGPTAPCVRGRTPDPTWGLHEAPL